ncbi:hypothetical protein F6B41_23115 [Microbacterium lushaniae]|nr:hypothetical protein F6B41_23115 [Microbacterium lushaniae]
MERRLHLRRPLKTALQYTRALRLAHADLLPAMPRTTKAKLVFSMLHHMRLLTCFVAPAKVVKRERGLCALL